MTSLLLLVLMGVFFYFLLIRPQQRRARQQRALIDSLDVGDEVMTVGGLFGTIRRIQDDRVTLEVAPGVDLQYSKSAIARRIELAGDYGDEAPSEEEREAGSSS
ncbi:MAG: preprotein translocase subunit YajC [Actinomycetota bacterium]|nr:preprotein translocase subunit YajC [Actinomycetota bacterium]